MKSSQSNNSFNLYCLQCSITAWLRVYLFGVRFKPLVPRKISKAMTQNKNHHPQKNNKYTYWYEYLHQETLIAVALMGKRPRTGRAGSRLDRPRYILYPKASATEEEPTINPRFLFPRHKSNSLEQVRTGQINSIQRFVPHYFTASSDYSQNQLFKQEK